MVNLHETFITCSSHLHVCVLDLSQTLLNLNETKQQAQIMKNNIVNTMGDYSPQIEVAPRIVSTIIGFVTDIQKFVVRVKLEQALAKRQMNKKRQMISRLHQDTIDQMLLD